MSVKIDRRTKYFLHHPVAQPQDYSRVKAHWDKHYTQTCSTDHPAHRLMALVLKQIRQDNYQVQHDYTYHIEDIWVCDDPRSTFEQATAAVCLLADISFVYGEPANQLYIPHALLDTTHKGYTYARRRQVNVKFNPAIHNYLLNVARLNNPSA